MRRLSEVGSRSLRPLLDEERDHWAQELFWDFSEVTSAISRGIDAGSVSGFAVEDGMRFLAYAYAIGDPSRTVVGSIYAADGSRGVGLEERLAAAMLADAQAMPAQARVECQTLFSTAPGVEACFARAGFVGRPRHYLVLDLLSQEAALGDRPGAVRPFRRQDLASAAQLIHRSHVGSLDAALNVTYSSLGHCRGFVETVVLRNGCGRFDHDASFVAEAGGDLVGVVLVSRLSPSNGHICQVSVAADRQGHGLGKALMVAALTALRQAGAAQASLSVTVGNERACGLYSRLGFRVHKRFGAHAWLRPPARIEIAPPSSRAERPDAV
jgi:ribosomal protein S18 acetylase RimI-like enzyme